MAARSAKGGTKREQTEAQQEVTHYLEYWFERKLGSYLNHQWSDLKGDDRFVTPLSQASASAAFLMHISHKLLAETLELVCRR